MSGSASGPPAHAPFVRSELVPVGWATAGGPAPIAAGTGAPVTAVGVPVLDTRDGPVVAEGVPDTVSFAGPGTGAGSGAVLRTALDPGAAARRGFTGKAGKTMVVVGSGDLPTLVFVGCGRTPTVDTLRQMGAAVVRGGGRSGAAAVLLPASLAASAAADPRRGVQAVTEGAMLASYRFVSHKSEAEGGGVEAVVVAGAGIDDVVLQEGVRRGVAVARAVCLARDLVNEPPSSMTPTRLAEVARAELLGSAGVGVEVWDEARIADERLGGLLGVARGSAEPPRLVRAVYEPADPLQVDGRVPHVVLVGKGITFDSGGLSLKTAEGMVTMKTDMSGAAAVLATVSACGELGVRVRVTAIAPTTENMPGGRATKPGDVLTIRNGSTIEVLNTDAEGRLVLADGLCLAVELEPDAVVDLATLTGACVTALGSSVAGVFASDDDLLSGVQRAAERGGEDVWQLPLVEDYESHIESEIADMKNIGKPGQAGAIVAALLLARFVEGTPWVHMDIAGPARTDEDAGVLAKGGTGFGVRTLLELLADFGGGGASSS